MPEIWVATTAKPHCTIMNTGLMKTVRHTVGPVTQQLCRKSGSRRGMLPSVLLQTVLTTVCECTAEQTLHTLTPDPLYLLDSTKAMTTSSRFRGKTVKKTMLNLYLLINQVVHWLCNHKSRCSQFRSTNKTHLSKPVLNNLQMYKNTCTHSDVYSNLKLTLGAIVSITKITGYIPTDPFVLCQRTIAIQITVWVTLAHTKAAIGCRTEQS